MEERMRGGNGAGYVGHCLIAFALCSFFWFSTNLAADHQYFLANYDGHGSYLRKAIGDSLEVGRNLPYALAFYIPFAAVVLLKCSRKTRLIWIAIVLYACCLPFADWSDGSKEIVVDVEMYSIATVLLPLLAAATFLVLGVDAVLGRPGAR